MKNIRVVIRRMADALDDINHWIGDQDDPSTRGLRDAEDELHQVLRYLRLQAELIELAEEGEK